MREKIAFSAPDLARLPIAFNLRAISLAEGARAGLSVAVIIALNEYLNFGPLREATLAALLTCICDPGGPIRRRVPVLLSFALMGAAITAGYGLIRDLGPAVALPIGVFGLFCCSFARIYGQAPQQLSALLSVVQILSLDRGDASLTDAAIEGAAFICGSLWATLLTMVIWRIYPFLPARQAVGEVYRVLSMMVRDLEKLTVTTDTDTYAWEAHARIHRRAARDVIEAARNTLLDTIESRGSPGNRAAQALIRLETADQVFGGLIALSELLENSGQDERTIMRNILRRMRPVLVTLGRSIIDDDQHVHLRINRALDTIALGAARLAESASTRAVTIEIIERLRIAHTMSVPANISPGIDAAGRAPQHWQRLITPLRANLTWKSPALRHAVRTALAATGPLGFTMVWFNPYDHWLTITIVATMQPYFSLTYTRAIERIAGTMIGGLIAAGVGLVCTTPIAIAVGMFVLSVFAFALRTVSFSLFMLGLTPLVVLLVETGTPGTGEWMIAFARAGLTAAGGVIAVAANFLLWPSREPELIAAEVKQAIAAHATYAEANLSALLGETPRAVLGSARRAAGLASNNLEALITRSLLEPGNKERDRLEAAMVIDAALRRFAGRLSALQHDTEVSRTLSPEMLREWRDWTAKSLTRLSGENATLQPRPTQGQTETLARLARQIELIAGALPRLTAGSIGGEVGNKRYEKGDQEARTRLATE